ncbi:MAG TPA: hypothetical protein VF942_16490 [Acidimicrobiales bacterium]
MPLRQGSADRGAEQHHARVVDDRVEPAGLKNGALHRICGLRLLSDVGLEDKDGPAIAADVGGDRLEPVLAARRYRHAGTVGGERGGGRRSDAARRARHEGDGAIQYRVGARGDRHGLRPYASVWAGVWSGD